MNLYNVKLNISYGYPKMQYMSEYFDVNSLIFNKSSRDMLEDIELRDKPAVQKAADIIQKTVLGDRKVITGTLDTGKVIPESFTEILNSIHSVEDEDSVYLHIVLCGIYEIIHKSQRSALSKIVANFFGLASFRLRNDMAFCGTDKYSIAFKSRENFGLALIAIPSDDGVKGKGKLLITCYDEKAYYIDEANKYFETTAFVDKIN